MITLLLEISFVSFQNLGFKKSLSLRTRTFLRMWLWTFSKEKITFFHSLHQVIVGHIMVVMEDKVY